MSISTSRFRQLINDFQWVHQGIGILGGVTFFVGSIFFLWESTKVYGVWLFIVGSFGMLVGNLGSFLVKYERHELDI
ncbi:MAG TPA: YrhK family protein [Nocardioidaceae bacterium]|nr:YrhK family protein [Nocardioidaceae bacterium]